MGKTRREIDREREMRLKEREREREREREEIIERGEGNQRGREWGRQGGREINALWKEPLNKKTKNENEQNWKMDEKFC